MNVKNIFINEYQKQTGAHYKAAHMVWVKASLAGDRAFIHEVLKASEERKAAMKVKVVA